MQGLTTFQYDILAVLADEGTVYGLKIKRELEERHAKYGSEVNHGRLYPNLDTLVGDGLVQKAQKDKRTNEYTLTHEGRELLQRRIGELTPEQ